MARWRLPGRALVYGAVMTLLITYYVLLLARSYSTWSDCFTSNDSSGPYGDLADAFVHGRSDLLIDPDSSLLTTKTAQELYDPGERPDDIKFIWDYSYYKNSHSQTARYYLYFGPAPAIIFFCPAILIVNFHPSESLVLLIISALQLLVFASILRSLVLYAFKQAPLWLEGVLLAAFGICDLTPAFQERPQVYELATASGMLFSLACFFFLFLALVSFRHRYICMTMSGTSLALAMSCRYINVLIGAVLFLAWAYFVFGREFKDTKVKPIRSALCLFLPAFICGLSLMYYNYVRFDNPFETGIKYQINGVGNYDRIYFALKNIPDGLWNYYLLPYQFVPEFPFVDYWHYTPSFIYVRKEGDFHTGLFTSFPICLLCLAWPYYVLKMQDTHSRRVVGLFGLFISTWTLIIMLCLTAYFATTFRHEVELQWPMLVLSTLALLARSNGPGPFKTWELLVLALLVSYSCLMGFIYSLIGPWHWIEAYLRHV